MTGPPVVAVVGRPNVGKSSLVNRILGQREAIVDATPGVTRDRRGFDAEWSGRRFELLDTGGLEPGGEGLEARVVEQAHLALDAADVVVLVVDGTAGILEDDSRVADLLRRSGKPVVVAVNKLDDPADEPLAARFYRLGLGDPHPVSALHGRGSGDLLDAVVARLPVEPGPSTSEWASVGIVGRPNVGKSSLLNALVGVERAIVDAAPGTTRDPVDARLALPDGRSLRLADTAGMRRGVQIKDPIEYFSWLRSRRTLERVDAVVLVVDAAAGVTGHDQRIAEEIVSAGRACVVALNKWDRVPADEVERGRLERAIDDRLRFLEWAPVVRTSAITGRGVGRLAPAVTGAVEAHRHRIPTARTNDLVRDAQERRPPPRARGRAVRVLYGVQAAVAPPTFVLFATGALEPSYLRYVERRIRSEHPFAGSPIRVMGRVRARGTVPA